MFALRKQTARPFVKVVIEFYTPTDDVMFGNCELFHNLANIYCGFSLFWWVCISHGFNLHFLKTENVEKCLCAYLAAGILICVKYCSNILIGLFVILLLSCRSSL